MKQAPWLVVIRVAALVALAASGALWADYSGQAPTFCTAGSGCAAIRQAGWGYVPGLWVPVPAVGAAAFALLLGVSLLPGRGPRRLTLFGAVAAGVIGLALLAIQGLVIGAFCALCAVVDLAALAAGAAGLALLAGGERDDFEPLHAPAWALLGAIAFVAPYYWPKARPAPDVPAAIQKFYQPGKINVVEFADYQCPYCRMLHPTLKKLNAEYDARVNFVRLNMPLASHAQARPAAHAFVCAAQQGKGDGMGDLLFETEALTPRAQRAAAQKLGLDLAKFDACLGEKETHERVEREARILRDAGFDGLPTTYVGSDKIIGAQPEETFRAAYERAARGVGQRGVPLPLYLAIVLAALGAATYWGRGRSDDAAPAPDAG